MGASIRAEGVFIIEGRLIQPYEFEWEWEGGGWGWALINFLRL